MDTSSRRSSTTSVLASSAEPVETAAAVVAALSHSPSPSGVAVREISAAAAAAAATALPATAPEAPRRAAPGVHAQTDIRLGEWVLRDASVSRAVYLDLQATLTRERVAFLRTAAGLRNALARLESERNLASQRQTGGGFTRAAATAAGKRQQQQQPGISSPLTPTAPQQLPVDTMAASVSLFSGTSTSVSLMVPAASAPSSLAVEGVMGASASVNRPQMMSASIILPAAAATAAPMAGPPPSSHIVATAGNSAVLQMEAAAKALSAAQTIELLEEKHAAELSALRERMTAEMEELTKRHEHESVDLRAEIALLRTESVAQSRAGALERERLVSMMERSAFESVAQLKKSLLSLGQELDEARKLISSLHREKDEQLRELNQLKAERIMLEAQATAKRISGGSGADAESSATNGAMSPNAATANRAVVPFQPPSSARQQPGRSTGALVAQQQQQQQTPAHRRPASAAEEHQEQTKSARMWLRDARQELSFAALGMSNPLTESARRGALLLATQNKRRKTASVGLSVGTDSRRAVSRPNALDIVLDQRADES